MKIDSKELFDMIKNNKPYRIKSDEKLDRYKLEVLNIFKKEKDTMYIFKEIITFKNRNTIINLYVKSNSNNLTIDEAIHDEMLSDFFKQNY